MYRYTSIIKNESSVHYSMENIANSSSGLPVGNESQISRRSFLRWAPAAVAPFVSIREAETMQGGAHSIIQTETSQYNLFLESHSLGCDQEAFGLKKV